MDKHHKTDKRRTRRTFAPNFNAEAVRLCKVVRKECERLRDNGVRIGRTRTARLMHEIGLFARR